MISGIIPVRKWRHKIRELGGRAIDAWLGRKLPRGAILVHSNAGGLCDQINTFMLLAQMRDKNPDAPIFLTVSGFLKQQFRKFAIVNPNDIAPMLDNNISARRPRKLELLNYDILEYMNENDIKFMTGNFSLRRKWRWRALDADKLDRQKIQQILKLIKPLSAANTAKLNDIKRMENSICMHIRRGDYMAQSGGKTILPSYYANALREILSQAGWETARVFVFSEELDWAEKNIDFLGLPHEFVNINDTNNPAPELELMRACRHYIRSVGQMARMAAYLNPRDPIVISPAKSDYYTESGDIVNKSKFHHLRNVK
jgi:hypothetical protein